MDQRVGFGYDIHRLTEGRKLILGGIEIPYVKGLLGHSDADVLLHAVCDSLLGALSLGDIGEHFPDTDSKYKDASSIELLKKVLGLIQDKGFVINNIDTVVIMEEPKLGPFKNRIQQNIAKALKIKEDQVSIKAKTNEGLGLIGKNEAAACYAVSLLLKGE